ncbi:MAG: HD domain-containing protein [Spirochaetes bacterium]|nr:HD domain-containing protein [Spirochaetota bacterium]
MNPVRKFIPRQVRFTLSLRLTLYFIVFGIVVGYFTFLMVTVITTHEYLHLAVDTLMTLTRDIAGSEKEDFVPRILNKRHDDLAETVRLVNRLIAKSRTSVSFRYYIHDAKDGAWRRIYLDGANYFRARPAEPEKVPQLREALRKRLVKSSDFYYGRSDTVTMMIGLSPERSGRHHVLEIDANREGVYGFIRRNRNIVSLFGVVLVVFSALLGKLFAVRISRPIHRLSDEASKAASGDLEIQFTVRRSDEIGVLADSLNQMTGRIRNDVGEIERRMKAMEAMNRIDKAVLSSISRTDLLDRVVGIVSSLFPTGSIAMVLRNQERGGFDILNFYRGGGRGMLEREPFVPDLMIGGDFVQGARTLSQMILRHPERSPQFVKKFLDMETGSLLNVPIVISDVYLGSLLMIKAETTGFTDEEVTTVTMLADQTGVALQSVKAFEEKENILLGIMLALTKSIDAKSKWTAGHSERVARLAEGLAMRIGFGEKELRTLTFSAILHDIGKIAVPEFILDKPSLLTREEYEVIMQHPSVGAEIIYDIPSYGNIVPGILYHHERWDGGGYPLGLRGDEIPLNGRLISLADVYDAITADRPYRKGMDPADAVEFMSENGGKMFDPVLGASFLEMLRDLGGRG